ncbi:MAG: hypothetical protein LBE18_09325 [Planctomycetaceae bacterium]|jgi:hypothetical protein|nr:hypothetical protein [Planctomycetaceae bacterium]
MVQHSVPDFMRTILDISKDINFHLSKLRELSAEVVSVHKTAADGTDFNENGSIPKAVRKRRTRVELKILIEAAVDAFGGEISTKEFAEKAGIAESLFYREPYSTYLEAARKEYEKKCNAKRAAIYKKIQYEADRQ